MEYYNSGKTDNNGNIIYRVKVGKTNTFHTIDSMPIDTSWDWIMKIVKKIESFGYDSRIHGSDSGFLCDFVDVENNEIACEISDSNKKEAVVQAIVQAINHVLTKMI